MTSLIAAQRLGIEPYATSSPVELRPNSLGEDIEIVIRAAYRQVLGNAYVMSSERLETAESMLRNGSMTVKEFVRALALSETYRNKYFYSNPQNRFIELNYKHLLGRAPNDHSEIKEHNNIYAQEGYEADINSYIDSAEYQESFGDWIVPYHRGFSSEGNQKLVGFTRMFQLYRGHANSDRTQSNGNKAKLVREIAGNIASPIYSGQTSDVLAGQSGGGRGKFYRIRVAQGAIAGRGTRVRRSDAEYLVPYEQLSNRLQQINRQGGQVLNITSA